MNKNLFERLTFRLPWVAWLLVVESALAQVKNPFERSMFQSQASKGKETTFLLMIGGAFLLVGVLYIVRSYLRSRSASISLDDMADQDLTTVKRGFFGSFATMVSGKRSVRELALNRLVELDPPSLNCSIVRTADGREANEDAGRAVLFHMNGEMFLQDRAFFITTPDGIKAEDRALFSGEGEVMNLWFLHDRIPYTVNCEVRERMRFPAEMLRNMDPKIGVGYRLVPLTNVAKRDKRQTIRFSHKIGRGSLRVYPQVLFDVYIQKTDFRFPTEGSIPPRLNTVKPIPYRRPKEGDEADLSAERVVTAFKEAIRLNHSEDRVVYVSKPYMDERTNKCTLIGLGYAEVLGLGAQEAGRTIHIKKPMKSMRVGKNRRDPHYLNEGDIIVLDYMSRSPLDGKNEYYEMPCQIIKSGIENITIRPRRNPRQELNLPIELLDFSVNGLRFENSREFMGYVFEEGGQAETLEEQKETIESMGFVFTFYPKLRFTRDTEMHKPDLPLKFSILGKIARCEVEKNEDTAVTGHLKEFGVRYTYDPAEYSRDDFCWDRWTMIRPFKENSYFKEVHKSLNGLIAHLENQSKDFLEPRRPAAQAEEKVTA
ncbi:MAG: hypothetical protein A3F84_10770 [Candidatus Handelsmanbacteria bacterium RIFCSPLOWO2_12_FULL_64_10]|uniref:Uncharacterized protein n=1 Tax=Handelsmanbacteria sp. (strain RIFCSPLOWO2_12_FULL_64_10) TaxID=1817868 RepID=A0A1F6D632_HANXR|nr:MAG: hypothetical protein A3F84_10770 [Candidatus Handelsmanbacteria bacterium RIFCSPLOWO2_12_FULL_64_10]